MPTGTIMAYIGTTPPVGWLLCDGSSFPDNVYYAQLKSLLGGSTNTPNLTARYLRGSGTNEGRGGLVVKGTQDDSFKPHNHSINLTTNTTGNHNHDVNGDSKIMRRDGKYWVRWNYTSGGTWSEAPEDPKTNRINVYDNDQMVTRGDHSHTVSGNTGDSGNATANETRTYSYGVNWIIKI